MKISQQELDALAYATAKVRALAAAKEGLERAGFSDGAVANAWRLARVGYAFLHDIIAAKYGLQTGDNVRSDGTIEIGERRN